MQAKYIDVKDNQYIVFDGKHLEDTDEKDYFDR